MNLCESCKIYDTCKHPCKDMPEGKYRLDTCHTMVPITRADLAAAMEKGAEAGDLLAVVRIDRDALLEKLAAKDAKIKELQSTEKKTTQNDEDFASYKQGLDAVYRFHGLDGVYAAAWVAKYDCMKARKELSDNAADLAAKDARIESLKIGSCVWSGNEDDLVWSTTCKHEWEFSDGRGPVANGAKFCQFCGGQIEVEPPDTAEGAKP